MMVAIEAGADDVVAEGGSFRVMTEPSVVYDVKPRSTTPASR
jgi:transcriptional/translational regulatory protein YebC/TACO1